METLELCQASCQELCKNPAPNRRVLSIQSHVVHGYAGNKCSVFTLQLHGYDVDPINSVQFSNHSQYEYVKGKKLSDCDLDELYEGLKLNNINVYSHVLAGYCGQSSFLLKVADVVNDLKSRNPNICFYCDPVMGDNGQYYTPKDLLPIYRDILLPLADVITPNVFELGELAGRSINDENQCLEAINAIHEKGVKIVVVTSSLETPTTNFCYSSMIREGNQPPEQYRYEIPIIPGTFVGTGDTFTSLLLIWMDKLDGDLPKAIQNVIGSMQGLLKRTSINAYGEKDLAEEASPTNNNSRMSKFELQMVQSRLDLLCPRSAIKATRLSKF